MTHDEAIGELDAVAKELSHLVWELGATDLSILTAATSGRVSLAFRRAAVATKEIQAADGAWRRRHGQ